MTSEQILCFLKVAETGSFTAAAEAMYMTQPSLSKRINALEAEVSLTLFTRDKTKPTQLTEAGRVFYEGMKQIRQNVEGVLAQARNVEKGITGILRMGIYENQIIDEYLQEILNDFTSRYPNVELYVTTSTFNGLIEQMHDGSLDCVITLGYDIVGRPKLKSKKLYGLKTCLVVPNSFLDETWKAYQFSDFWDKPFLTISESDNTFYEREFSKLTKELGFTPKVVHATDEKNFMMMLEMGKGMALLDEYSKCCKSPNVRCFTFPEISETEFHLAWTTKGTNPALKYLLEYLQYAE